MDNTHVPHDFVHHLGQSNGVRRRARARHLEAAALWVRYVALVVRRIQVLAVPAAKEDSLVDVFLIPVKFSILT